MKTLREILQGAERRKVGVGHFNVSDLTTLKAAFEAARELESMKDIIRARLKLFSNAEKRKV
jgi:fructose/tagatose bisphosphate aldolase